MLRQTRPAQALEHMCKGVLGPAAVVRPRPHGRHSQARPPPAKLLDGCQRLGLSAKLAARGFGKERQAELVKAAQAFKQAFAARGKERGAARAQTLAREAVFRELRTQTSYFRRMGREALRNSVARADFDRVHLPVARPAIAPVPAEESQEKMSA